LLFANWQNISQEFIVLNVYDLEYDWQVVDLDFSGSLYLFNHAVGAIIPITNDQFAKIVREDAIGAQPHEVNSIVYGWLKQVKRLQPADCRNLMTLQ